VYNQLMVTPRLFGIDIILGRPAWKYECSINFLDVDDGKLHNEFRAIGGAASLHILQLPDVPLLLPLRSRDHT
jgi:hypothetical protein